MNDVRARFLKSILEQLPADRIVELHFFTPIRQGQVETGVAVIAAEPERPLPLADGAAAPLGAGADDAAVEAALDAEAELAIAEAAAEVASAMDVDDGRSPGRDGMAEDESPYAAEPSAADAVAVVDEASGAPYAPTAAAPRFEVITAVYRWTRKGPERGKWEVDVTTEADAPLPTVGTVVQGVHDRAGEELEPLRLTHAELQALLSAPTWQTTP